LIFLALFTLAVVAVIMGFKMIKKWCQGGGLDCRKTARGRAGDRARSRRNQDEEEEEC